MLYIILFLLFFLKNVFFIYFVEGKNNFLFFNKNKIFFNKRYKINFLNSNFLNLKNEFLKFRKDNFYHKCKFNIVIDPGHGGYDPGAIGYSGSKEKDITLLISKKLFYLLNLNKKFNVFLIRSSDNYVSLKKRLHMVHIKKADLFLSIHVNSINKNKSIKGASIWLLSLLSKYRYINKKKYFYLNKNYNLNYSHRFFDFEKKISQLNFNLAIEIIHQLRNVILLHKNYLQYDNLFILSLFYIPSILIEVGYISNPVEEKKLNDVLYQYKLAKYIYLGLEKFINKICV